MCIYWCVSLCHRGTVLKNGFFSHSPITRPSWVNNNPVFFTCLDNLKTGTARAWYNVSGGGLRVFDHKIMVYTQPRPRSRYIKRAIIQLEGYTVVESKSIRTQSKFRINSEGTTPRRTGFNNNNIRVIVRGAGEKVPKLPSCLYPLHAAHYLGLFEQRFKRCLKGAADNENRTGV